jgi:diguanylate cyclase (GGDEF)-like protein
LQRVVRAFPLLLFVAILVLVVSYYAVRARRLQRSQRRLKQLLEQRTAELSEQAAQLEIANFALEEMATIDALTGIANRRRFDVFIQQEWLRAHRSREPLSLLLLDADYFKAYNDRYGHQAGDEALRQIANVLRTHVHRATDLAARFGGEEFTIVLANTGGDGGARVAETIRAGVEALQIPHAASPLGVVTVSLGVATANDTHASVSDLIGASDRALYEAKNRGRNRVYKENGVRESRERRSVE